MICLYVALCNFQAITMDKTTVSSSSETPTAVHLKYKIDGSQRSPSFCDDNSGVYNSDKITCSQKGPLLPYTFCATYNEDTKILSIVKCPYFQPNVYNIITQSEYMYIQLPKNLSQLNVVH